HDLEVATSQLRGASHLTERLVVGRLDARGGSSQPHGGSSHSGEGGGDIVEGVALVGKTLSGVVEHVQVDTLLVDVLAVAELSEEVAGQASGQPETVSLGHKA